MATRTTTKKAEPKTTTAKTAIEKEAPAKLAAEPETKVGTLLTALPVGDPTSASHAVVIIS